MSAITALLLGLEEVVPVVPSPDVEAGLSHVAVLVGATDVRAAVHVASLVRLKEGKENEVMNHVTLTRIESHNDLILLL